MGHPFSCFRRPGKDGRDLLLLAFGALTLEFSVEIAFGLAAFSGDALEGGFFVEAFGFEGFRHGFDEGLLRVIPIGPDTAHIYAPCRVTVGELDKPPATANYLINEFAVRTPEGWKISTIA